MVPPAAPDDPAASASPDTPASADPDAGEWFPRPGRPSPRVPPIVTISTTPAIPPLRGTQDGTATEPDDDGWLVGEDDVAPAPRRGAPAPVPTLVVTPPSRVVPPDPGGAAGTLHRHHRRPSTERVVAWSSALVGAGGLLLGLMLALVNVEKWPESGVCTAYRKAHHGHGAFGCGGTRAVATILPPVVTAVLVIGVLAVVWIPHHTARRRLELIAGLAALLVATAFVEALVYAALP